MPYAKKHLDHASSTKCEAEQVSTDALRASILRSGLQLVLAANSSVFYTCALRPEMVFGPGDNHFVPQILDKASTAVASATEGAAFRLARAR